MDYLSATDKCVVYINSANRLEGGTSSSFNIDLRAQIPTNIPFDQVVLTNAAIPKSWQLINARNNIITFNENGTPINVMIDYGNYSADQLGAQIGLKMSAASVNSITYTVELDERTGTYIFTKSNALLLVHIEFNSNSMYDIIGFDIGTYYFAFTTLISPNSINLQLTNTIKVVSDMVYGDSILSQIIPNSLSYSTIVYQEQNAGLVSKMLNNVNSGIYRFSLLDEDDRQINLHGINWQCTIVLYRSNSYYKTILQDMELSLQEKNIDLSIQP